jgi:micrococcal nuclease
MKWFWSVVLAIGVAVLLVIGQPAQAQQQCDPSYPDICLAPPPPDLDCAVISI